MSADKMDLLRFITAGSVDDGKSTLIGRLLYDSKSIFEDQLQSIEGASLRRGKEIVDLSLLTDGLQAEREQGITIDVAYRYFATPKRKFIIADTPGHEQYTRNMATAASTANLAIILIDARKGMLTQSRRHTYIAHLLGIPHIVVAINKMDLVDYSSMVFNSIRNQFTAFARSLGIPEVHYIPMSALNGDMVVDRGDKMDWYKGQTLIELLENIEIGHDIPEEFRFPVQGVNKPNAPGWIDFRGYMGRIVSGSISVGEPVTVLPSGLTSRVKEIFTLDGNLQHAFAPQSVTLVLEDQIDISRGDMLVKNDKAPATLKEFSAMLCWLSEQPLDLRKKYSIKQTTRSVKALVPQIDYRIDINTLVNEATPAQLKMNEIGLAKIKLQQPIVCDDYKHNRATGSFIIIDESTNNTVAAGMIANG
jgi:sulfate adenylyltransferase subunit 1